MRIGNYYDLNSHKNPILDFVQQMVSEKRGDTLSRLEAIEGGGRSTDPAGEGLQDAWWPLVKLS